MKTVTTSTFKTLIEQLKENEKGGNGKITSLVLTNGFFRAVLEEGSDTKYSQSLASLTGDETDNIQDKIDFLLSVEDADLVKVAKSRVEDDHPQVKAEISDDGEVVFEDKAVAQQTTEVDVPEVEVAAPKPTTKRTRRGKKIVKKEGL